MAVDTSMAGSRTDHANGDRRSRWRRRGEADHPALPIGPEELTGTAAACLDKGAAMIHLHVRDRDSGHFSTPTPIASDESEPTR